MKNDESCPKEKCEFHRKTFMGYEYEGRIIPNECRDCSRNVARHDKFTPIVEKNKKKNLLNDFWKLTPAQRWKIMQDLNLLEPSDDGISEVERNCLAFERAAKSNKIKDIEKAVYELL